MNNLTVISSRISSEWKQSDNVYREERGEAILYSHWTFNMVSKVAYLLVIPLVFIIVITHASITFVHCMIMPYGNKKYVYKLSKYIDNDHVTDDMSDLVRICWVDPPQEGYSNAETITNPDLDWTDIISGFRGTKYPRLTSIGWYSRGQSWGVIRDSLIILSQNLWSLCKLDP